MPFLELAIGLVLLLAGGEALVRGSVVVATRLGVSPLVIGLTLVGFGTSMPELVASVQAALVGAPGIAIGNIIGSNIANILLILGISALILPVAASSAVLKRDGVMLFAVSMLMFGIVVSGTLERWFGVVLITALAIYTIASFILDSRRQKNAADAAVEAEIGESIAEFGWPRSMATAGVLTVAGIAGVILGADFLVDSAVKLAELAGISQAVIGLTIVAIGTSLPELATSVIAAIRRQGDVALGNVIGSNIFNILGIAGATAIVTPIPIPAQIIDLDVWVMLLSAVLLVAFAATGRGISRREGAILVVCYGLYLGLQFSPTARAFIGI
ncbi:calcium/sodium antiporter [Acuticoccus sp. M5D2P5]|uniref:calcium/sodium antiporter n=1 Tax=Acuticoccus kalidii TaxID=2910977 RepID=UPI001F3EF536|nr:calcium/sodium antiporter [Acuticoccus kalidii]MCF3933649.1 calcium/sodium antiporter [Acuticoccus kalidii]